MWRRKMNHPEEACSNGDRRLPIRDQENTVMVRMVTIICLAVDDCAGG